MKHLILGTAGHIDHGKTSLVKALTGIDTDRLPEEKARGITIDLGFAPLFLPGEIELGIVDVPGHERFVRTMVAGIGGIDLVMLVIAADEGVMPQTREHLEICQLLGVRQGLVALTKIDMVDHDWLGMVTEEVRDYLAGSFLADAPIVPVSSRTGAGMDEIKKTLADLASAITGKKPDGPPRLPVDRVFTVAGYGTVVTGTLLSGGITPGDEMEVLPAGLPCRVRGIQCHGKQVERGVAGQRLAVNLQGAEHTQVTRGDIVVPREHFRTTRTVDVRLDYLPSAPRDLKHRSTLRLHSATFEVPAQVILIDRDSLRGGESAYAQLRLAGDVLLLPGDPFVLRTYSPAVTLGGGRVLDPFPPRMRRRSSAALKLLLALETEDDTDKILSLVASSLLSGLSFDEIVIRTGLPAKRAETALAALLSAGEVIQANRDHRIFIVREAFNILKGTLLKELEGFTRVNPLKGGIGKEELKSRFPRRSNPRFFGALLTALEKDRKIVVERELVKLPGDKGGMTSGELDLQGRIEDFLRKGDKEPPTVREICELFHCPEKAALDHLSYLAREGRAVKVKNDLFYSPGPLGEIRDQLLTFLKSSGSITPNEFRDLTGLSRKFMIPVLEYFDSEKLTIRVGDKRLLRKG